MLCDCPGLVFPSAYSTRAEMILNGVIPIHSLKDPLTPLQLLVDRIPSGPIAKTYHLALPHVLTAALLVQYIAVNKKFYSQGSGQYDVTKVTRFVLEDYVNGKLCWVKMPPGVEF